MSNSSDETPAARRDADSRARILVVDDDRSLARTYERLIERAGGQAEIVAGVEEAIGALSCGRYCCVLVDKSLPDGDGLELARAIRRMAPTTEIVLVTGYPSLESAIEMVRLGAADYFSKPFEAQDVVSRVGSIIARCGMAGETVAGRSPDDGRLRHLEQQIEKWAAHLMHADRLATLGTLAAGVGHELKNVATVLGGVLSEIEDACREARPPDAEVLDDLETVFRHVRTHASNLLNLGRPGPDHSARFDARDAVRGALDALRSAGKTKYIRVATDMPPEPVWVTVNRVRLEQIIVNLAANAADALSGGEAGGRVEVKLWQDAPRGRVFCRVSDDGSGIPSELLEKVFEPYFTTKPPGEGTGLGLPVVRQIVESYGGMLRVESVEGRGTSITFDIPEAKLPTILPEVAVLPLRSQGTKKS